MFEKLVERLNMLNGDMRDTYFKTGTSRCEKYYCLRYALGGISRLDNAEENTSKFVNLAIQTIWN